MFQNYVHITAMCRILEFRKWVVVCTVLSSNLDPVSSKLQGIEQQDLEIKLLQIQTSILAFYVQTEVVGDTISHSLRTQEETLVIALSCKFK